MSKVTSHSKQSGYENIFEAEQGIRNDSKFTPPSDSNHRIIQQLEEKYSSAFFKDHVEQQYVIQRAFNSNNFTYLRNLPDNFKHGQILNQRKQKVAKNSEHQTFTRTKNYEEKLIEHHQRIQEKKKEQIGTLGYFNIFPYQESNYEMPKILDTHQRIQCEKKRKQISQLDFRPAGVQAKMKYQDPFKFIDKKIDPSQPSSKSTTDYLFPFHLSEDNYNTFHESQKRRKFISDSLKLDGDFLPAKKQHTLSKATKQQLGQIVSEIQLFLKKYLREIGFFIGVTRNDHIQILFDEKLKGENRIALIMSKICQHELLSKYILKRNLDKWGKLDNQKGYLIYSILPGWVRIPSEKLQKD